MKMTIKGLVLKIQAGIDSENGKFLEIEVEGPTSITASGQITLSAPTVIINGNLQVNGNIDATGHIIDAGGNTNHHAGH